MVGDRHQIGSEAGEVTHYITMRMADALPRTVLEAWHDDIDRRVRMIARMKGRPLLPDEERDLVRRTLGRVERYLDSGRGRCVLADPRAAGAVEEVLWRGDRARYCLRAWTVMPNHVHALVSPMGNARLDEIISEWKSESTRRVNQELHRTGNLWHADVIDYSVGSASEFARLRSTIISDPDRAGLHDWPFVGEESAIPVAA